MKRKSALESLMIHGLEQKWYILAYIWYFFFPVFLWILAVLFVKLS